MKTRSIEKTLGLSVAAIIVACGLIYWVTGWKYHVEVLLPDGHTAQGADVFLSYVSDPSPPQFTTDSKGRAHLPRKRAVNGGWTSIIATYTDAKGRRYMGTHRGASPAFPVSITLAPRD
jgi:hypothetical protein